MVGFIPDRPRGGDPGLDLAEQKSWQNYVAAVLRMTTLLNRQLTEAHELSLIDVQLLALLGDAPAGSLPMGHLVTALPSLPSRLTRQIRRLEDQGLVKRTVIPHDRRRVVATLTDEGRTTVEQAMITYADSVRTHFLGPLTRSQITAVANSCQRISDSLKNSPNSGPFQIS